MVETIDQLRALFPEITDEAVSARIALQREEKVQEADRKVQSLKDQLAAAEADRQALDAQG